MNTILTVEEHKPLSHQDMGWQNFTNEALKWINEKDGPVVFYCGVLRLSKPKNY